MDPVAPVDYQRWAVLINPFPVPVPNTDKTGIPAEDVPTIEASVPSQAYGSSADRSSQGRQSAVGSNTPKENAPPTSKTFPISVLSSGTTDTVFRILLNEQNS